jgi:hypothetical protein
VRGAVDQPQGETVIDDIDTPGTIVNLIDHPALPADIAAHHRYSEHRDCWYWDGDVMHAIDTCLAGPDVDPAIRGALELLAAYTHIGTCDGKGSAGINEHLDRAEELLHAAEDHGIDSDETNDLWVEAKRWRDVAMAAAAAEEFTEEHGVSPYGLLENRMAEARRLYEDVGDRAGAIALMYEVARTELIGVFANYYDRVSFAWYNLINDAIIFDGPKATRQVWAEARDTLPGFPHRRHASGLIECLSGRGVTDIIEIIARELRADDARCDWPMTDDEIRALELADAEINGTLEAG